MLRAIWKNCPKNQKAKIIHALKEMKNEPAALAGVKSMVGDWAGYRRLRVGSIRIIFWIDESKKVVYVDHIGPRGDIYKDGA
ncbi:MAG: type II toxin-antitoxin system RelE/ParE family toxin [Pseudomonadota bacterium]|nr:type II toxin-antitoxin system RelE/ParE family toxin [Pseudomonadota bacterium]